MSQRIATRFALMMSGAAILPLLAFGAVSIFSVGTGARDAVIEGNRNVATQVAEQIHIYVTSSVRILNSVAAQLQETGLQRWQQDRVLKNSVLDFPEYRELTLLDGNGSVVATSRVGTPTTAIPGSGSVTLRGALISPFTIDDDLLPSSVVAVRLTDPSARDDDGDWWLIGRLNLEELWRTVDGIRVGRFGYALVVGADGRLLAHGNPEQKSRVARGDNLASHPLVASVREDESPDATASAEYDTDTGTMLGVAAHLPELGWTVIVEQPTFEAFAIPIALQRQLGVATGLALLAMLIVGYLWGRSFINPILRLTRGTAALAEGHLDARVDIRTRDEIGQLGAAFNDMAGRLAELQEDVRKKERQAMFGRIAIGLVHDLSHPIQNIGNSCKLMLRMWDDIEYRDTFRSTVERELAQVKRVLDDLRNVARPLPLERFPIDVNKAITEVVESMQATAAGAGLTLDRELVFGSLFVEADLFALNRVCRNLIMNAMQATAPGGRVVVRTGRDGDHATIEVTDTGCGIAPERLETIFEDFMTTKRRGLGLGLAISRKVVEQLGGTIAVASRVGLGSTFTLRFPLTKARPSQLAIV